MKTLLGGAAHDVGQVVAAVQAGDDVHVDDLVGALLRSSSRANCCGSPITAQPFEVDALDQIRPLDVEPRDEPNVGHVSLLDVVLAIGVCCHDGVAQLPFAVLDFHRCGERKRSARRMKYSPVHDRLLEHAGSPAGNSFSGMLR